MEEERRCADCGEPITKENYGEECPRCGAPFCMNCDDRRVDGGEVVVCATCWEDVMSRDE